MKECTYTAPSFRRGPPKGYIQALEHRLHQVESVLAAIMSSADPRAQSIIEELSHDELAGYILETVDVGPFGKTGREKRSIDTTKDNFFSSIVTEQPKTASHRSRRESRATRENVIESVISTDNSSHTRMAGPAVLQARHPFCQSVPEPTLGGLAARWVGRQLRWVGATEDQETTRRYFFVGRFSTDPVIRAAAPAWKYGYRDPESDDRAPGTEEDVRPERPQRLSKLLLLSMFAYAASHLDPRDGRAGDDVDPAGVYTKHARTILDTIYHESRSSTVQALILLGIREFGAGSLEEGWLHIGMATRMADLGLNRNPDKWTHNGRELFTEKEKTIRKRIWWACCLADK
ncbi:hypothetical protein GSI_03701 [Ganoderma sinense ZZ0214-1]|uniref:Xylanolytic transcriptional activator regulatory domain-containing protein n=1 Tax=Ganoderma sinense ZZ0214-1 TaxID=1077348 RepID=A0A2G8SJQ0_9APHY|nr:hypothetical protein GSI_03701 [Ganoderma sinense ZZ0214-1]